MAFFFLKLPGITLIDHEAQNTGHTALFILLTALFLKGYRLIYHQKSNLQAYVYIFILLNIIGISIELIQIKMLRDADALDLLRNLSGIITFMGIDYFLIKKRRQEALISSKKDLSILTLSCLALILSLLPISTLLIAYNIRNNAFPTVISFNSIFLKYFYTTHNATIFNDIKQAPLGFNLVEFKQSPLTGISIVEPIPNWQGYSAFCFNIYTPLKDNIKITLRINDRLHNFDYNDRFNQSFYVNTTLKKHCFKLSDIANSPKNRTMDLTQITNIQLFQLPAKNTVRFYLSHFWLE